MASVQVKKPVAPSSIRLDEWTPVDWDEFAQIIERPEYQQHKAYYHDGRMRIESMPVGSDHATDHAVLIFLIGLFGMVKDLPLTSRDACSYRKEGVDEFQPDISYHIGENAMAIPKGTRLVDLDKYPQPDLVIEVSDTTLRDDKGEKRLQYEDLRISEYWIWDVKSGQVIAFAVAPDGTSQQIRTSKALSDLSLDLLEESLRRIEQEGQSATGAWFMQQIQA